MSDLKIGSRDGFTVISNDLHISGNVTADGSGLGASGGEVNITTGLSSSLSPGAGTVSLMSSGSGGNDVSVLTTSGTVVTLSDWPYWCSAIYATPSLGSAMTDVGALTSWDFVDTSSGVTSSNDGGWVFRQLTAASTGSAAYCSSDDGVTTDIKGRPYLFGKFETTDTTEVRYFVGFSNTNDTTVFNQDTPTSHAIGIQFSTARGDTNWQIMANNGSGQALIDTGVPVTAATVYHIIVDVEGPGHARVTLFDGAMNEMISHAFNDATNLPAQGAEIVFQSGHNTLATATAKEMRHYFYKVMGRGQFT